MISNDQLLFMVDQQTIVIALVMHNSNIESCTVDSFSLYINGFLTRCHFVAT